MKPFIVGTRGSDLAVAQTGLVEARLREVAPALKIERRVIRTTGDTRLEVRLGQAGSLEKGLFTKELEDALAQYEIDAAIHSLKDLPTKLAPGLTLAAVLARAPVADILISKAVGGLPGIPPAARIATSSLRRRRLLQWLRTDLEVVDIRGNVPTRIRKLHEEASLAGLILAEAGLSRLRAAGTPLRLDGLELTRLDAFLPAPGQGAIGIEARADDDAAHALLQQVNDPDTWDCVNLERAVLSRLGGGCHTPLGIAVLPSDWTLDVRAVLFEKPNEPPHEAVLTVPRHETEKAAEEIIRQLLG